MAKGEKAGAGDEPGKRDIMAAVFFGIRLFRSPPATQVERDQDCAASVRDADALIGALDKIP